eukprot:CAMPEP_0204573476 /NCGR_PEP_ID=MMETSP0661-20131031/40051_1 /ASSEMBLY_ACC=CAM_ASM_000606 /TAXON_ID=109239 /ORGANISM="Alexandrium margalefi, Strain AMGDE01CS-322" /LENGTH=187 /DNA_ID=CAMNT_0051581913 /DNA_START=193 /DNA_END=753 /DNA_ORIENTATION=+
MSATKLHVVAVSVMILAQALNIRHIFGVRYEGEDVRGQILDVLGLGDALVPAKDGAEHAAVADATDGLDTRNPAAALWCWGNAARSLPAGAAAVASDKNAAARCSRPPRHRPASGTTTSAVGACQAPKLCLLGLDGQAKSSDAGLAPGPPCKNAEAHKRRRVRGASAGRSSPSAMSRRATAAHGGPA